MDAAKGEWICWLDSDDEYTTNYLRQLDRAIKQYPDYKIFNFRTIYQWPDKTTINELYQPAIEGAGHEWFRSGHFTCGGYIFNRDLWKSDPKYRMPDQENPFQFAAESKFPMKFTEENDEWFWKYCPDPANCFQDGVYRQGVSLGNPWGDDFLQLYLLTRDNHTKPLDMALYITYPRTSEDDEQFFGELFETGVE